MSITKYLQEVRTELTKVTWPSRNDATRMTLIVVGASLLIGLYIGGLDLGLTTLLGFFLN